MTSPLPGPDPAPRVLVVEDDPLYRRGLTEPLVEAGYAVESCADGQQALERVRAFRPDVVVTDWEMPRMDGITLCRVLKSIEEFRFTHVIILSSLGQTSAKVTGLDTGADDYLVKPVDPEELRARVRSGVRLQRALSDLAARNELLSKLALTDPLTGMPNRRAFEETLAREVAQALRHLRPLSLLLVGLDRPPGANDTLWRPVRDAVLTSAGLLLARQARRGDLVARIGGEELAVVLPETGKEQALVVAERVRAAVSFPPPGGPGAVPVAVSIGAASLAHPAGSYEALLGEADAALRRSKSRGRDRVQA